MPIESAMQSQETSTAEISLNDQPGHLIRRAHQISVSVFYETLGREVTPVQYAVMRTLQDKPGIDQVTLAQQVALDTSSTADIAVRLEGKGWITRKLLARGQRELRLTADGEALLERMVPGMQQMQNALLGMLSDSEREAFLQLLSKFVTVNNERSRAPMRT
ncbi:MarR family winged helix-turn-helix transcriptional regulator [Variovorax sp. Sphag1AA]|uniref:MarR family winged helix-turn-helix transcriptional regulator n=1 Tax=Variovorax sp. Sphag1AA TaxID=2587027 RepID=UPI0017F16C3F|nr:MarR family transcriptional regulator [Variovorax sp. Sphag1AA]MBB3176003.1 DNA-binding MarR family transcriptional regulator [Variovorax sp. Sphag1AA]